MELSEKDFEPAQTCSFFKASEFG